jgi:uncharacterized membrane-anchored protein YhcB (DUF1043 family)
MEWNPEWITPAAVALAIGFGLGALALFAVMRRAGASDRERAEQLATELEETREELESHREEVARHFARTSDLFRDLTEQYTQLYAHLANGARAFCPDVPALGQLDAPLLAAEREAAPAAPETRRPAQSNGGAHAAA